ncbi:DUF481 domain-containing protein [Flavobacterium sp.]|uniref:DUF481 domain-containing protein n=1 Tax=Flavobacterium sp. TaxID=239 RepID=UPI0025BB6A6C|nr:DUF481 domain-containing protein [Flavobacterium sp.]MBA4153791.1 hypothetical protein [Flavobacterium sp.]
MRVYLNLFIAFFCVSAFAQKDTITFKNKDVMVGELKQLNNNILTVKTSYSDKDFAIEFDKVVSLVLENKYSVVLSNGFRMYGYVKTETPNKAIITQENNVAIEVFLKEIVVLRKIDDGFWNHFKGSFDFGFNLTQTNNSKQFTFAGALSYYSERWIHRAEYNQLFTSQDDVEDIERTDWSMDSKRYLKRKWFVNSNFSFLSNTSQSLKGRFVPSLGAGNYLARNNQLYFLVGTGLTYNIEKYEDSSTDKTSTEAFLITEFNMFNFKKIELYVSAVGFPSLSESGRFRTDANFRFKYDLPFDFYFKTEVQVNFDNQPAAGAVKTDYVFSTGFGWEIK